ncbi:hydroxyacid dehydrogenase [Paenibacillus naphthalenovorans]|uniref:hydroxyacid dehydrogenase n=1 Tax=Paenibacillus naphthalenovorans TaxID=162209 RepID=UPI003D2A92C5
MKRYKVMVAQPIAKEGLERLEQAGLEVIYPEQPVDDRLLEVPEDCDAILIRTAQIGRQVIEQCPQLKVIARHGIGVDNIDMAAASEKGIFVTNVPRSNTNSVAEHVVGMMIALAHHIVKADKVLRKGRFEVRNLFIGSELAGKTLGLIGYGNIGRLVVNKCTSGLGMNAIVYDPYVKEVHLDGVRLVDSIETILTESDFVSLHLPYLPEMHHFINAEALKKMKNSAYLINCARGGLVDEEALYHAIQSGDIAGAGLDVFEDEPAPKQHLLWELEQVIVTPHMAAHTKDALIRMAVGAADEIIAVLNGKEPAHCVNRHQLNRTGAINQ